MQTVRETQAKAGAHGISIALLNQSVDRTLQGRPSHEPRVGEELGFYPVSLNERGHGILVQFWKEMQE